MKKFKVEKWVNEFTQKEHYSVIYGDFEYSLKKYLNALKRLGFITAYSIANLTVTIPEDHIESDYPDDHQRDAIDFIRDNWPEQAEKAIKNILDVQRVRIARRRGYRTVTY